MSLTALASEFRNQAAGNAGNITVNTASFTAAALTVTAGLDNLIQKGYQLAAGTNLLINTSNTTIPDPVGNTLTIQGTATVLNVDAAKTSVSFVITDDGTGNVQFVIVITLSNWVFSTSWMYMTGGVFDTLPYSDPAFIFSSNTNSQYVWMENNITLVAGQNFACLITLTGLLQQVTNFLTSWNGMTNLALTGMLDPSKVNNETIIYPDMNLKVMLDVEPIQLVFLNVANPAVGFKIVTIDETDDSDVTTGMLNPEPEDEETDADDDTMVQTPSLYFELQLLLGTDIQMNFITSITPTKNIFDLGITSDPQKPLTPLSLFSLMAGNNWFSILPPTLQQYLNTIAFKSFTTSIDFNNGPSINSVSAQVGSVGKWVLFDNFSIDQFDVQWLIIGPGSRNTQFVYLSATVNFFPTIFQGGFDVEVTSDLTLSASFSGSVTFNNLLFAITGGLIKIPDNLLLIEFTGFGISMDIPNKYYEFYANTNININFITNISVTDGSLRLTSSSPVSGNGKSVYTAAISGLFAIGSLQLNVGVNYDSSDTGGWKLNIAMPAGASLNIGELMKQLFEAITLPSSFLPDNLLITEFSLASYIPNDVTTSSSYEVKTALDWKFTFPIIEQKINIIAKLWIKYETKPGKTPSEVYSGGVMGTIILEYFNAEVNIGYNFAGDDSELIIEWEGFTARYNVEKQDRTITFSIKNWTLGGLVTSFMKMLFNPTFELDAPWDVLNYVSLDGFSVTYNLDTKDIKVTYKLPKSLDLIFITINGINLTKTEKGVYISFDGSSPVPSINESSLFKPAKGGQDIQQMPEVPGQGTEYFDLRLLAMGQHVALNNSADYKTILQVTEAMQNAFTEPEPGKIPIGDGSGNNLLSFSEDSNWLIATNFGILNAGTKEKPVWTVDMQVVFNDPNLYGLRIALNGEKAKVLKGLEFEIMYKKISDSIGVYQIDLTLPDALRNLQFGAVNITLPSISLEIYTNGDFMVDIGFPYNMDFSRSFTLQAIVPPGIPAMGSGGFYFGKLSSATTNKVPATSYGNFNPVIVFGIGLQVGVGYSVNYGILSAGFSLTLFGIIEGVIATYHPYAGVVDQSNPQAVETSYYYYLQGTIGIIGKLYGSIDFGIISASVNITIMIYAQATFEAYNKIPLAIVASVDVRVSASLNLGIFSITIHFSFTAKIRQDLTIGTDDTANAPWNNNLTLNAKSGQLAAFAAMPLQSRGNTRYFGLPSMHYSSTLAVELDDMKSLNLYFVPHLTVSGPEDGKLKDQRAQYVATLFIDAPDPSGTNNGTTSFEYLCADFFRWLVLNYINQTPSQATRASIGSEGISKEELDQLVALLSNEGTPFPIPTDKLLAFLQNSFKEVNIQVLSQNLPSAAIFPMFFDLELSVPDIDLDIHFSQYNMATAGYLTLVKEWFAALQVSMEDEANAPMAKMTTDTDAYSLSTFVFEDYFVLIGKQLAGFASDAMANFKYRLSNGNSLQAMVSWANGITVNKDTNRVRIQDVAIANQNHPLNAGVDIAIAGVVYLVVNLDTFVSIAAQYAITPAMLIELNGSTPGVLAPQTISFGGKSYDVQPTDTMLVVATGLNTTLPLLAADPVFQSAAILNANVFLTAGATIYSAKNGDTFNGVATTVYKVDVASLLMQNQITPGLFITDNSFIYNGTTYKIVPGDTLTSMAAALSQPGSVVTTQDLASSSAVQALQIQPLGQLMIQSFSYTTAAFTNPLDADTLLTIATQYGTTTAILASNYTNQQRDGLFYSTGDYFTANVPDLKYLDVDSILEYFVDSNSYGQLSGMASRYQLHGMRLPTDLPGLTLSEGSPCTVAGKDCALFSLTGQQFGLPADVAAGFTITLINKTLSWLKFNGKSITDPDGGVLDIQLTADDIQQISTLLGYAQTTGIIPKVSGLEPMKAFDLLPVQYTFQTTTKWKTSGVLNLPYGSLGNQNDVSPLIWEFPMGMLRQLALPKEAGSAFDIQIGQYDAAKGVMNYSPSSYYGWNTMVEIELKRMTGETTAVTNAYTYELMGADEAGATILQELLLALHPDAVDNNRSKIIDIQWLYEGNDGLLSVGMDSMKSFVVQANFSTETNPSNPAFKGMLMAVEETQTATGILNSTYDFIRLLWECSITRSGGYYLLYNETESNKGFPDTIFGKGDTATIRLMLTYSNQYNNKPATYMNCAVTADKIDASSCVVYAQSALQKGLSTTIGKSTDTLAVAASRFNILLSQFAELNKDVVLNTTVDPLPVVKLQNLVYVVGTPGLPNTLDTIVKYYNVDATKTKDLNPAISDWNNLPLWQLILIPEVDYPVSSATGTAGNMLSSIAAYYFIDMSTLAWAAKDVVNLFPVPTTLTVDDQIQHKVSSVPQGTAGFDLQRSDPGLPPAVSAPGYADIYLSNLYNLLSYQIVENNWFKESVVGLPAGPVTSQTQDELLDKPNAAPSNDGLWLYNQIVPVSTFAKPNKYMIYPAGYPQESDNPYRGIGQQVQVHFDWVDYYGNNTVTPFSDPQLDPGTPLNNPAIPIGYTDELKGLSKWPSLELSYQFDLDSSSNPELKLEFNFNDKRYVDIPDVPPAQQQDWKKNASNDLIIYTNIYYQLTQLNPDNGSNTLTATLSTSLTPGKQTVLTAIQFSQLVQFVKDTYTYLSARSNGNNATVPVMAPIQSSISSADIDTTSILQLTVNLDFYRDLAFVNNDFKDSALVTKALTIVKPKTVNTVVPSGSTNSQYNLNEFSAKFEAAFLSPGNYKLKIATGTNAVLAGGSNNQAVFVVRMGLKPDEGIYWSITQAGAYEITLESIAQLTAANLPASAITALTAMENTLYNSRTEFDDALIKALVQDQFDQYRISIYTFTLLSPVFYAPKPLATSLISKNNVPVCKYETGTGLDCSAGDTKNFTGINMDNWAAQALGAIDVFLSSDYAVPGFLVDQLKVDEEKVWLQEQEIDAATYLEAITNAKKQLAKVISEEVEPILTAPYVPNTNDPSSSLGNAQAQFEQQLLNQLSNAYDINALVQLKVTAQSDFKPSGNNKIAPRLYGAPYVKGSGVLENNEYSISTAKVQLNPDSAVSDDSYLNFTFSTKNVKSQTSVPLTMSYVVTHIEFDINEVPGIDGYLGSNWLTFIIPADIETPVDPASEVLQQSMGTIDIPVVLRNYPTAPTFTTQVGDAIKIPEQNTTADKLAMASQWEYVYAFTEDQAAQDKIFSEIEFNLIQNDAKTLFKAGSRDLFNDMAQFVTVWPQVLQDFNKYLCGITAASTSSDPNLTNAYAALQTFVTLTNNLAIAWSQFTGIAPVRSSEGATKRAYDFMIRQQDDNGRLLLSIVPQEAISPADYQMLRNNQAVSTVVLPQAPFVSIEGYTKVPATDAKGNILENEYWYQVEGSKPAVYLSWADSLTIPLRTVHVNELNVLQFQYAWAGLSVIRNEDLIPFNPTVNDFIYRTPLVKFSNKLIPLLSNDTLIDVAKITNEAGVDLPLAQQLANFLSVFFKYDELKAQLIKLTATWNYSLLEDSVSSPLPAIQLPILLAPPFTFEIPVDYTIPVNGCQPDFSETDPFVCKLSSAIKTWFNQLNPTTNGAWIQLDLSVFSSLSESKLPLIELNNVVLYYQNITDL